MRMRGGWNSPHVCHWCSPYWTTGGEGWKSWPAPARETFENQDQVSKYLVDCCPRYAFLTIYQLHPLLHGHPVCLEAEGGDTELRLDPCLPLPSPSHLPPSALTCTLLPGWQAYRSSPLPPTNPASPSCHHVPDHQKPTLSSFLRGSPAATGVIGTGWSENNSTGRPRRILLPLRAHISALWPSPLVLSNDSCRPDNLLVSLSCLKPPQGIQFQSNP